MAEEEEIINTDIDDWLNDLDDEDGGVEELDQADIDSLLGGDTEVGDNGDAGAEELGEELEQADIDSLLGDADMESEDEGSNAVLEDSTIDQEEMDKLFGVAGDEEGEGQDVDFAEILGEQDEMAMPDMGDDGALEPEAFTLEPESVDEQTVLQSTGADFPEPPVEEWENAEEETMQEDLMHRGALAGQAGKSFNRKSAVQMLLGLFLVSLLGGGIYFYLLGEDQEEPAIVLQEPTTEISAEIAVVPPPVEKPNHEPLVEDDTYRMPEAGGEVMVKLQGEDQDGDQLSYELVDLPQHGRLSGTAPNLVYLPNADFPGKDSFSFRASDGRSGSEKSVMHITGPVLSKPATAPAPKKAEEKPVVKPEIRVAAADIELRVASTDRLVIDWSAIWREAGNGSAGAEAGLEANEALLQGRLDKIDEWHWLYTPPKFYAGDDILSYRFKKGKKFSVRRLLTIAVDLGDHEPEINLAPLAATFLTGETVVIDARATRDDQRNRLRFVWQQLAGTAVKLEEKNGEGSVVSFIMPSAFAVEREAGLVIQVTAVDAGGKKTSKDIHFQVISRRQDPLWGLPDTGGRVVGKMDLSPKVVFVK